MKMSFDSIRRLRFACPALASAILLAPVQAQTTQAEEASKRPGEEEILQLSPFVVNTTQDAGYLAANTVSGSRLNTPLTDTPASISELTPEFLADINANNVQEAFQYSLGFSEPFSGSDPNPQQENDINVSTRGLPRAAISRSVSRNYFIWFLNGDAYNIERLSLSRGPNSILFGLGEPGGMANSTTKRTHFRTASIIGAKFDSEGSWRATADQDLALGRNAGLRINLLSQDVRSWRESEYNRQERVHLAGSWRLGAATSVHAEFERGITKQLKAPFYSAQDKYSGWVTAGSLLYNRTTSGNTYPAGVSTINNNAYLIYDADAGQFRNWQRFGIGNSPAFGRSITDSAVIPYEANITGPAATTDNDFHTYSAFVEHRIGERLYLEAAYNYQTDSREWLRPTRPGEIALKVDPNLTLPGGAANPNAGKYFIEDQARYNLADREISAARVMAAYKWDSGKPWLGRHNWVLLASDETVDLLQRTYLEANLTPLQSQFPLYTDARNRIIRRTYLDFNGGNRAYNQNPFRQTQAAVAFTDPTNGLSGTITPGFFLNRGAPSQERTTSLMAAGQSYFADGRLAVTYGYRHDKVKQRTAVQTLSPTTNEVTAYALSDTADTFTGDTYTYGFVYHILKGRTVSLYANFSDNFQPQTALDMNDQNVGNIKGKGHDFGLKFNLLDQRLYATLGYYKVDSTNRRQFDSSEYPGPINQIWSAIDPTRTVETGYADTSDFIGTGYELEVVGSPVKSLTLSMNIATSEGEASNINPRTFAYVAANRQLWLNNSSLIIPGGSNTVGTVVGNIDNFLVQEALAEGRNAVGNVKFTFNLFAKYRFTSDLLKNWSLGAGARYRDKTVLGYTTNSEAIYADGYWLADLRLGYSRKVLAKKATLGVNLSIQNLFDNDDLVWLAAESSGVLTRYRFQTPRLITLTTDLKF